MSDQYEAVEEFEEEVEDEAEEDAADADDAAPDERALGAGRSKPAREEVIDEHTIAARQSARDEMARQIEEFLARGGRIQEIAPDVTADPPRKPDNDYGGRAI